MKVISNIVILLLLAFGGYNLYMFQYDRAYEASYYNMALTSEEFRQLDCLAENIYYEAAGESLAGRIGVAQVTLQRVESGKFPDDVCKVVHQKHQFSWTADKPKGLVKINKHVYNQCREVAKKVLLEGERLDSVKGALYYHTKAVNPVWNKNMTKLAVIGEHIYWRE